MMKYEFSPIVTIILNIIAGALVARGVLDTHSKEVFVQLADNIIAGLLTAGIGFYSIGRMVDLHKHKITNMPAMQNTQTTIPQSIAANVSQNAQPVFTPPPVDQSGLNTSTQTVPENQPIVESVQQI